MHEAYQLDWTRTSYEAKRKIGKITEYYIHRCKSNILKVNVDKISHKLDKIVKHHNSKGTDSDTEKKFQIIMI